MANAPIEDQLQLLELQALDTKLAQLVHQRKNLPQIEGVSEVESRIADLSGALVASRTAASDLKRELTKAETDVEQVESRLKRDQERLDSGSVSAKDATALLGEIEKLTARQSELEEIQLEVMDRLESHNFVLEQIESQNAAMQADLDAAKAALAAADADVVAQGKALVVERDAAAAKIDDAPLLALYTKVKQQNAGIGAAALVGNRCGGCRMELNPVDLAAAKAAAEDKIVRCEDCSRILVRVPEPKSALAKATFETYQED